MGAWELPPRASLLFSVSCRSSCKYIPQLSPFPRTLLSSVSHELFQQPLRTQSRCPCQDLENALISTFPLPRQVPPFAPDPQYPLSPSPGSYWHMPAWPQLPGKCSISAHHQATRDSPLVTVRGLEGRQADLGKDPYLVTPVWPGQPEAGLLQPGLWPLLLPAVPGLRVSTLTPDLGCRVHPLLWVLTLAQETVKHKRPFLCSPTPPQNQVFDPTTCKPALWL